MNHKISFLPIHSVIIKRITILCFLMILVFPMFGQNISFLDPSLKWNIGTHCVDEGPFNPYDKWSTYFLHTEEDTLMNGKHYKKLVSCTDSLCGKKSLKSYIREEARRVFLANKIEELILYDFNLQKGDTMIMQLFKRGDIIMRYYIRIDSVKTLLWPDQKERIAQYATVFSYYNSDHRKGYSLNDVFVEGIGSLKFGLEYPMNLFVTGNTQCSPTLLCFYSGGNLTYSNPTLNKCYLNTASKQLSNQTKLVSVFAVNEGNVEIQLNGNHTGRITFFDLKGNQILAQNIQQSNTHVCLPSSGIYIFHFISERGNVQTGKILVN